MAKKIKGILKDKRLVVAVIVALAIGGLVGMNYGGGTSSQTSCSIDDIPNSKHLLNQIAYNQPGKLNSNVCYGHSSIDYSWDCYLENVLPEKSSCGINGCTTFGYECWCFK